MILFTSAHTLQTQKLHNITNNNNNTIHVLYVLYDYYYMMIHSIKDRSCSNPDPEITNNKHTSSRTFLHMVWWTINARVLLVALLHCTTNQLQVFFLSTKTKNVSFLFSSFCVTLTLKLYSTHFTSQNIRYDSTCLD